MHQSQFLFVVVAVVLLTSSTSTSGFAVAGSSDSSSNFDRMVRASDSGGGGVSGVSQRCTVENASFPLPPNVKPNCYRCFCKEGFVQCVPTSTKCERLQFCPIVVYNETKSPCCPKRCKSCSYLGQEYESGEQWLSSQDTCRMLTCKGGVVTMGRMECVTLCPKPESLGGYCCPLCPREIIKNSSIASMPDRELMRDPCIQCSCKDRWCHCFKTACPALDCPNDQQYTPSGRCCPECRKSRSDLAPSPHRCTFQGAVYKNEQNFRPDECTLCKCQDGVVICRRFVCPILDCPKQRIHYEPDLCCPRCRETDPLPCDINGLQYKHGDQWSPDTCTRCKCSNGVSRCESIKCPELHCPRGFRATQATGKCCPECEEADGTCTVFGDPHYQTFDGRSFNFQGTCRYVLAKVCDPFVDKDLPNFNIIVQNEPRGNEEFAWTRHVSVRLGNDFRIALLPKKQVRVNRKQVKLPHFEIGKHVFTITLDRQNNVLLRIGKELKLVWDGNSYAEVTLSKQYKGRVCGLCGNYNNDTKDDLVKPDATVASSVYSYGQSWRIGSWKACKSSRDRQYHEKMERERRRQRQKIRQRMAAASSDLGRSAFLNIHGGGDEDRGRLVGRLSKNEENKDGAKKGRFVYLDRVRIADGGNNGQLQELMKLLSPSSALGGGRRERDDLDELDGGNGDGDDSEFDQDDDETVETTAAATGERGEKPPRHRQEHRKRHQMRKICAGGSSKWRTRRESIEQCRLLKSPLFASCHSVVPVQRYFRSCIMDTCACPPSGRCYCESLLAYARKCEKENVFIDWRSHSTCVNGNSNCAIQGAVFSPCAPKCVRKCSMFDDRTGSADDRNSTSPFVTSSCPPVSNADPCTPGCYCPDGTAQLLNQCVPIDLCPQSIS